ncbi:tetratricopeptide repeat-containing sulfotransferase family protein [Psychrobium sp. 1_MG-2023]|uniref:tetratricopeptide repeat-containing sulfotransferase family protein n=1 Tax=Psychrobium sp. 1_MG-2023 TaxID=3062624 RepID=UPI000C337215|nr:tetratricopeptide repeat-containing sulfotransferase family protein [Psychrobium sp. 1_MG-2023]MDP2562562.1 sulfotransferase [Psychrobium sp. 1_MG-2023]PKF54419.1 hypothetical protein CW748_15945 [Alteromonadales bacterium alter-6D02]
MFDLKKLRQLADNQQFNELQLIAEDAWLSSYAPVLLPLLALAYAHLGLREKALEYYQQAESYLDEYDNETVVDMAAVLLVTHRFDEAKALLKPIVELGTANELAVARLGYCYLVVGQLDKAKALFEQALALAPERLPIANHLINIYLQLGYFQQAQQLILQGQSTLAEIESALPEELKLQFANQLDELQLQLWVQLQSFTEAEQWLEQCFQLHIKSSVDRYFFELLIYYSNLLAEQDLHQQASEILRRYGKKYPHHIELCLQLAELAKLQGQFIPSVQVLQQALHHHPESIKLWAKLSYVCLHNNNQKARYAAERAVELANKPSKDQHNGLEIHIVQLAAKNTLAEVESNEQNYAYAAVLYQEILDENPSYLPALQGLGQQQMLQGNIDEAIELFEKIKRIDPVKGHSALINARHFPEDEATLIKMEQAAQLPSLEGKMKSGILFQLASAWEKRKVYNKAFELAKLANEASKKFLPYDAKAHRNQCARIRVSFTKALYQHRPDCGVDSTVPVFVLGMPRSGTTLVEQIIAGHSDIFGAGELGVIPQVIQGLQRWERQTGSGRSYPDCVDDLTAEVTSGIANNVVDEMRALAQEDKPNAKHVVDKLPHNFENIGLIKFLFPKAKIISVRRDPRDIAMSNYFTDFQAKHGGMGFAYDLEDIGQQLADHNLMMHHWHQTFPGEILELNYEDVVDDLEGSARKLLNYIGVEWQPQVLKFNELDRTVKTASVWQVRQPIYKTSKAKWKRYEQYLAPLIKGTNAKIAPDPIDDMITLPVAGFLTDGVALYQARDLDGAELCFKKMLHHNPKHAACQYMLGLVYMSKNHPQEGVALMAQALEIAPWHQEWTRNLIKGYEQLGDTDKANQLRDDSGLEATMAADELDDSFTTFNLER